MKLDVSKMTLQEVVKYSIAKWHREKPSPAELKWLIEENALRQQHEIEQKYAIKNAPDD